MLEWRVWPLLHPHCQSLDCLKESTFLFQCGFLGYLGNSAVFLHFNPGRILYAQEINILSLTQDGWN